MSEGSQEEAYVLEKRELSVEEDEGYDYASVKSSEEELPELSSDDDEDLEDFHKLKAKTTIKKLQQEGREDQAQAQQVKPRVVNREIVIDDYIRNFLLKFGMHKCLNVFQLEWTELHKKGAFQDNAIGLITDTRQKNDRMREKLREMTIELDRAQAKAHKVKSPSGTWEQLRKERDFHKHH